MAARKSPTIEPIASDQRFADATAILRTLENGMAEVEREADALRIEDHLTQRPKDVRAADLKDRLKKLRSSASAKKAVEPATSGIPDTVVAALELLKGSRPVNRNRQTVIRQLESDRDLIRKAIIDQHTVIDAIRAELSSTLATRFVTTHRELMLSQFRAAQALAAATEAQAELRSSFIAAGYIWRDDLLRGPQLRAALVLGSESTFESDISRARRMLEELKIL